MGNGYCIEGTVEGCCDSKRGIKAGAFGELRSDREMFLAMLGREPNLDKFETNIDTIK